ncbi:filamentous hemagglutinin N-terminal domain-containing protein [Candidatus Halobeggiatoa sp. HSG11]|nr:filamentous hemagglutinin N-terminal domain-containing protein [Candidatus Halobeggiatoa sp. HSG11]
MTQKTIQACLLVMTITTTVHAEIVMDGTLGTAGNLEGPNFHIGAELGQQMGSNLFHSFETFDIAPTEFANFTGPDNIQNVISRVTGGYPSNIDGGLVSSMPNADMYFINPAGIMFGPNAQLDVQGSFHASTADYLRLGENGHFDATQSENSLLTVAPPSAFGFLSENPSEISKQGGFLSVPTGKTFSLVGGDLTLEDSVIVTGDFNQSGELVQNNGKVNLVSIASSGEIPIDFQEIPNNSFEKFGKITNKTTNINVSGNGGGTIHIIGGEVILNNSQIWADTFGNENGQSITIKASNALSLVNATRITAQVYKEPNFKKEAIGNGGNINIKTKELNIFNGSQIDVSTTDGAIGHAGNVNVSATESINISGYLVSQYDVYTSSIQSSTDTIGKGGEIIIFTPNLIMENYGSIRSDTLNSGNAGDILIQVNQLNINNGANINSSSNPQTTNIEAGNGGKIDIKAYETISIGGYGERSGLFSNSFANGKGGTINVSSPKLELQNNGTIQAGSLGKGNAGNIVIEIGEISLHNAEITTQSEESSGGNIDIQVSKQLYLNNGGIVTRASGNEIFHDGGNITIKHPTLDYSTFSILQKGKLITTSFQGDGGNINIGTEYFIESSDSVLDSSSAFGRDGNIIIDSSIKDFNEISKLSTELNRLELKIPFCKTAFGQSTFQLAPRSGLLASPYDLQR